MKPKAIEKRELAQTLRELAMQAAGECSDMAGAATLIEQRARGIFDADLYRLGAERLASEAMASIRRKSLTVHEGYRPGYSPKSGPAQSPAFDRFRNAYSPTGAYQWRVAGKPLGDCTAQDLRADVERREARSATDARIAQVLRRIIKRMAHSKAATVAAAYQESELVRMLKEPIND